MNERAKMKGLIRNQTCDNCGLYGSKKGEGYCTSSMLGRDLPPERTCPKWVKRREMEITMSSIKLGVKPKKLKVKWTKDTEMDIAMLPIVEEELIKKAAKEIEGE